jgi:hypothetical protein
MTFYTFHFLIAINSVQRTIISPFNALTVYYSHTGFRMLISFYTYMLTYFF